jgi:integrase
VNLDGQSIYLGRFGSKASRIEYDRVIAEWLANGRRLSSAVDITVAQIIEQYWTFAKGYYRNPDGSSTSEIHALQTAFRPLNRLYGRTAAVSFGPLALDAVRNEMIKIGWCRRTINNHVNRIRAMVKWAVAKELILPSVYQGLTTVVGLRAGRSSARESVPVKPVSDQAIAATLPFLSKTVVAMVQLQRLSGARPGEICDIRTGDIDRSGEVWTYTPRSHKNAYRGHTRTISIGPKGQEILKPFLKINPDAFCFDPREADQERRERLNAARKTPAG